MGSNIVQNVRDLRDLNLQAQKAFPAAGATATSGTLDLATTSGDRAEEVELVISAPALPSLVDTKNQTLTVLESADGVTFAAQPSIPAQAMLGAGGNGAPALTARFKLPLGIKRYLRLQIVADASAGDSTALSATLGLAF